MMDSATRHLKALFCTCIFLLLHNTVQAEIFKYQDQQGKWHFSDKKPDSAHASDIETLNYQPSTPKNHRPYIEVKQADQGFQYWVHNTFHAPIQVFFRFEHKPAQSTKLVLEPLAAHMLAESPLTKQKRLFHFRYVIGDPAAQPESDVILPPFTAFKPMRITQAFHGSFSHNRQPSLYAVDISMPVGTKITAVKSGIVISTKDDYHAAGITSGFFYDKANYVDILHDDGSYATYGHLLLGGVKVKPGEQVEAGEVIALSGNTGFSTGPHLHFAIRHNAQGRSKSLPFKFRQANQKTLLPERGMWLLPFKP